AEDRGDGTGIADIQTAMPVRLAQFLFQKPSLPGRRGFRTEKGGPHVIVDADHVQAEPGEMTDGLRADQTRRTGNHGHAHRDDSTLEGGHVSMRSVSTESCGAFAVSSTRAMVALHACMPIDARKG